MQVPDYIRDAIRRKVANGMPHDEVRRVFSRHVKEEVIDAVLNALRRDADEIVTMHRARIIRGQSGKNWYPGPDMENDVCWPALREYLLYEKSGFDKKVVSEIDDESTKIVASLDDPAERSFSTRGLVVGYVQSGKTANFTAVMAKAADAGYRMFIVLAGTTNSLRRQTQRRLNRELVDLNIERWQPITTLNADFGLDLGGSVNAHLTSLSGQQALIVAKKNAFVLGDLVRWLASAEESVARQCPVLVIDDEADYASVNTGKSNEERTTINRRIIQLLEAVPKSAYVGYTATPFANVFVNPAEARDLYPRDFIVALPKPDNYFGAETIFGRDRLVTEEDEQVPDGYNMIRYVGDGEIRALRPMGKDQDHETFMPEATESLREALRYFILATAARRVRAQSEVPAQGFHSTMMVHTSHYTAVQNRLADVIRQELVRLEDQLRKRDSGLYSTLQSQWRDEKDAVPASEFELPAVTFGELESELVDVCSDMQLLVANSDSDDELVYEDDVEGGQYYVVVGGNILSRGLTLEGLIVSFFVRTAGTYDALLQMGRWFGYWGDYADLPRLWMIPQLKDQFRDLAKVEQEIREDIARFAEEGRTPLNFAVQVPLHPQLDITSRGKIKGTEKVQASYSGREVQTTKFYYQNEERLAANWAAGRSLLERAQSEGCEATKRESAGGWLIRRVPNALICDFCREYSFHPEQREIDAEAMRAFIKRQDNAHRIHHWTIAVRERLDGKLGVAELGLPEDVRLVARTRDPGRNVGPDTVHIGALISPGDLLADLEGELDETDETGEHLNDRMIRHKHVENRGLALLYPISKDSDPADTGRNSSNRARLDAVHHILGAGLVFPKAEDPMAQEYLRVILPDAE